MKVAITFSLVIFLATMSFLSVNISNKSVNTYAPAYSSAELNKKLNESGGGTAYYNLAWKDRLGFEQSVWGFNPGNMLLLGLLFGVFLGSVKMAARRGKR